MILNNKERLGLIQTIIELNENLYVKYGVIDYQFSYGTDGLVDVVHFNSEVLWQSCDDDRYFDDLTNEYEAFKPFLIQKLNKYLKSLEYYL